MSTVAALVYRILLLLSPPGFRRECGGAAQALFERSLIGRSGRELMRRVLRGWWGLMQVTAAEWEEQFFGVPNAKRQWRGGVAMSISKMTTLRQAVRSVVRSPALSLGVIGLLGLGVGATVTVLSVVDGVLIRSLPYPESDRILLVDEGAHSWPDFIDWRETVPAFQVMAAGSGYSVILAGDVLQDIPVARVSGGFFELFDLEARVGRLPTDEELESDVPVGVLSHPAWERRWGADPDIVGRTVTLNGQPVEVIGVLSADFVPPQAITGTPDIILPIDQDGNLTRHDRSYTVLGRLAEGATIAQARAGLRSRAEAFATIEPDLYLDSDGALRRTFPPVTLQEATSGDARPPLLILLTGAGLLLLVAIGNAASLLLARGEARQGELAVRRALGGGPSIRHQLLTEATLLSLAGGALGLLAAMAGVRLVQAFEPGDLPRVEALAIDLRVTAMATALALLAGLLVGVIPAVRSGRSSPATTLRRAEAGARGRHAGTAGRWLVVAEATLASLLLVGSLTVVEGLRGLLSSDPGFDPANVWTVSINMGQLSDEESSTTGEQIRATLSDMPGVNAAGAGRTVPFQVVGGSRCCWVGELEYNGVEVDRIWIHPVTPGYFEALGITVAAGRSFRDEDHTTTNGPIILNQTAAREVFGDQDPIGRIARFGEQPLEVIGVIEDVNHWGADQDVEAEFYGTHDPFGGWASNLTFVMRAESAPSTTAIAAAVADVAPQAIVSDVMSMESRMSDSLSRQRFYSMILSIFAGFSLVLAMSGLGGTLLYDARQRRHELGVRMALGAPATRMARGVLVRGLLTVGTGAVLGLLAYWPLRRFTETVAPGVNAVDVSALAGFGGLLFVAVLLASWVPARLVAATDPAKALRDG